MDDPGRPARAVSAIVVLRVGSGLAWLQSALVGNDAKFSPAFLSGAGLAHRIEATFVHTAVAPPVATFLRDVVVPHAQPFAIAIAAADLLAGLSLVSGVLVPYGAAIAIARTISNVAVAAGNGVDTIGFNAMLALAAALAAYAGRRSEPLPGRGQERRASPARYR